jgi:hypothetical protein
MAAVTELVDRLGVVEALDTAVGPIKIRARGYTAGQLLVGVAAAQLGWGGLPGGVGPSARGCRGAGDQPGAGVVLDDRGGVGSAGQL